MKSYTVLAAAAAIVMAGSAGASHASTLLFTFIDPTDPGDDFSFEQSSNPTPLSFVTDSFTDVPNFDGTGVSFGTTDAFWTTTGIGSYGGPQVYSGTEAAPVFTAGETFTLTAGETTGTLSITTVPEPATWAIMLAGFAGLGGALRVRRRVALV